MPIKKIISIFEKYPDVLYGFANASHTDYKNDYKGILVFAIHHSSLLSLEAYKEEIFETIISKARKRLEEIQKEIEGILLRENCIYKIPPVAQTSEETLIAPVSFKYVAVKANLGWIGKNGVLITERYGPRVRLGTILVNFDFPVVMPTVESKCPDDCFLCVTACPHKALKGQQWDINTKRDQLIDIHLCNQKRKLHIKSHGRKHSCGFCIISCPIGKESYS